MPHTNQPAKRTDTERLDGLGKLLRTRDEMHEFWFDRESRIFWAGSEMGDDLRGALDHLIDEAKKGQEPK
jgi:hypothetical protein